MFQENASGWILLVARKQQVTRAYKRTGELNEGFYSLLTKTQKNCRCHPLVIDGFAAIHFFYPDSRVQAAYQEVENTNTKFYDARLLFSPDVKPVTNRNRS